MYKNVRILHVLHIHANYFLHEIYKNVNEFSVLRKVRMSDESHKSIDLVKNGASGVLN